ncbi:MAG: hypothetical protein ACYDA8_10540 [Deferrisomatales bacterium]
MTPSAAEPLARHRGDSGVEVEVWDETVPYAYADVEQVRLRVVARVPGVDAPYLRVLERLGVRRPDAGRVKAELLEAFERHALGYLLRPDFPARFGQHEARSRGRAPSFRGPR